MGIAPSIYGEPGTGKMRVAKQAAFKLGLPYAYLNFSYLIESYMEKTGQKLQRVFDFSARGNNAKMNVPGLRLGLPVVVTAGWTENLAESLLH